jgi:hypothetical protein
VVTAVCSAGVLWSLGQTGAGSPGRMISRRVYSLKRCREGQDIPAAGASASTSLREVQRRGTCVVSHDRPPPHKRRSQRSHPALPGPG